MMAGRQVPQAKRINVNSIHGFMTYHWQFPASGASTLEVVRSKISISFASSRIKYHTRQVEAGLQLTFSLSSLAIDQICALSVSHE